MPLHVKMPLREVDSEDATPDSVMSLDMIRSHMAASSTATHALPTAIQPPPTAVQPQKTLMNRLLGVNYWPFGGDAASTRDRKFRRRSYHSGTSGTLPQDQVDSALAQQLRVGRPRPTIRRSLSAPAFPTPLKRGGAPPLPPAAPAIVATPSQADTPSTVSAGVLQMLTKMQQSHVAGQERRRRSRAQTDSPPAAAAPCGISTRRCARPSGELNIGAMEAEGRDSDSGND